MASDQLQDIHVGDVEQTEAESQTNKNSVHNCWQQLGGRSQYVIHPPRACRSPLASDNTPSSDPKPDPL